MAQLHEGKTKGLRGIDSEGHRNETAIVVPPEALDAAGPQLKCNPPTESVVVRRWQSLPGLEVWAVRESARLFSAYHTTYTFCCLDVPGTMANRWRNGKRLYEVKRDNDVMLMAPGDTHQTLHIPVPASFHVVLIDPIAFGRRMPTFAHGQVNCALLTSQIIGLWSALERRQAWDSLECSERFTRLMHAAQLRAEIAPPTHPPCLFRLKKAKRLVEDRFSEHLLLDDIAREVGLHPSHLTRTFHAEYGMPLARYRRIVRGSMALAQFRAGGSLLDVVSQCGYTDQAHMTHEVRHLFGFTPGKYARAAPL